MHNIFNHFATSHHLVRPKTSKALLQYYSYSKEKKVSVASIKNSICSSCRSHLENRHFSASDLDKLSKSVTDFVIKKKDIYQRTEPRELLNFMSMLESSNDYDVVIDGLNIGLSRNNQERNPGKNILQTVKYFSQRKLKVLVIHREELKLSSYYNSIKNMSTVVTLDKVTQDDPFLILAALKKPGCKIVTNDHLRQHSVSLAKVDQELALLFSEWQVSHQISLRKKFQKDSDPNLVWPVQHLLFAHYNEPYWHVPMYPNETTQGFNIPISWLCVGPVR